MITRRGGMEAFALCLFQLRGVERVVEVVSLEFLLFARFRFLHLEDFTPNGSVECVETNDISGFLCGKIKSVLYTQ
jgi:hypothetical protein